MDNTDKVQVTVALFSWVVKWERKKEYVFTKDEIEFTHGKSKINFFTNRFKKQLLDEFFSDKLEKLENSGFVLNISFTTKQYPNLNNFVLEVKCTVSVLGMEDINESKFAYVDFKNEEQV